MAHDLIVGGMTNYQSVPMSMTTYVVSFIPTCG